MYPLLGISASPLGAYVESAQNARGGGRAVEYYNLRTSPNLYSSLTSVVRYYNGSSTITVGQFAGALLTSSGLFVAAHDPANSNVVVSKLAQGQTQSLYNLTYQIPSQPGETVTSVGQRMGLTMTARYLILGFGVTFEDAGGSRSDCRLLIRDRNSGEERWMRMSGPSRSGFTNSVTPWQFFQTGQTAHLLLLSQGRLWDGMYLNSAHFGIGYSSEPETGYRTMMHATLSVPSAGLIDDLANPVLGDLTQFEYYESPAESFSATYEVQYVDSAPCVIRPPSQTSVNFFGVNNLGGITDAVGWQDYSNAPAYVADNNLVENPTATYPFINDAQLTGYAVPHRYSFTLGRPVPIWDFGGKLDLLTRNLNIGPNGESVEVYQYLVYGTGAPAMPVVANNAIEFGESASAPLFIDEIPDHLWSTSREHYPTVRFEFGQVAYPNERETTRQFTDSFGNTLYQDPYQQTNIAQDANQRRRPIHILKFQGTVFVATNNWHIRDGITGQYKRGAYWVSRVENGRLVPTNFPITHPGFDWTDDIDGYISAVSAVRDPIFSSSAEVKLVEYEGALYAYKYFGPATLPNVLRYRPPAPATQTTPEVIEGWEEAPSLPFIGNYDAGRWFTV